MLGDPVHIGIVAYLNAHIEDYNGSPLDESRLYCNFP